MALSLSDAAGKTPWFIRFCSTRFQHRSGLSGRFDADPAEVVFSVFQSAALTWIVSGYPGKKSGKSYTAMTMQYFLPFQNKRCRLFQEG